MKKKIYNKEAYISSEISLFKTCLKEINELIESDDFKSRSRKKARDFTRKRKMPFAKLIFFMLNMIKCSTQNALERFFKKLNEDISMEQQSFSESRNKLKHEALYELFKKTVITALKYKLKTWYGYRVMAIDGSKIELPDDKSLLEEYGGLGPQKTSPTAQSSALYDVMNDLLVDVQIQPLKTCERTLASLHIEALYELNKNAKNLIILDRGYASFELIEELKSKGIDFLMRVKRKFNLEIDAQSKASGFVKLKKYGKETEVRVVKLALDNGEIETLITSLYNYKLGESGFKKLYFMRWPIETKFDQIKNKLELTNFSGKTSLSVKQDFYVCMFLANMASFIRLSAQTLVDKDKNGRGLKSVYKVNMNHAAGVLKDEFLNVLIEKNEKKQIVLIHKIVLLFSKKPIPIRKNRSVSRDKNTRNAKFHINIKSNI